MVSANGQVVIRVTPVNATVLIDTIQVPNNTTMSLTPGTHTWGASLYGYDPQSGVISIVSGQESYLFVNLVLTPTPAPTTSTVNIFFQPAETAILWDGAPVGNNLAIHPLPGVHTWSASATGYYPANGSLTVEAGKTYDLGIALAPLVSGGTSWPWPMSVVQSWFEGLYNDILSWIHKSVDWVYDKVVPLFTTVTQWVTSEVDRVWGYLSAQVAKLPTMLTDIISVIPSWIASEVSKVFGWIYAAIGSINTAVAGMFSQVYSWISTAVVQITSAVSGMFTQVWSWLYTATGIINSAIYGALTTVVSGLGDLTTFVGSKIGEVNAWFSNEFIDPFLDWLVQLPKKLWDSFLDTLRLLGKEIFTWYKIQWTPIVNWAKSSVPTAIRWLRDEVLKTLSVVTDWGLTAFSYILGLASQFITPLFSKLFGWFEKLGPVAPDSGRSNAESISSMVTVLIAGLGTMTIAGELLHPLKNMGLGNVAAMIYDLTNYKLLTAAFVGVLAGVYIRTPLTYYYNKAARPNLPNDRSLAAMLEDRAITSEQYRATMAWHGYPDIWIERIEKALYRPMTPYMLRSLAEAGLLDEDLLEHALNHAGYDDQAKVAIKQMMHNLAAGTLATVSTGTAMSRYQEGFDTEESLRQNLSILGVADSMLDRYTFAANLKQYYDYQSDLRAYYIDLYHRRDIEEPELRTSLATIGIDTQRIQLIVAAQRIKRLAAAKPVADPAIAVQFDTIRDKRKKQLITREQEISQLVAIGEELTYATALADNDDVALSPAKAVIAPAVVLDYETDEGKTKVDTIRRLTRAGQLTSKEEYSALLELQMPQGLASAIADNDLVRIKKASSG